MSASRQEREGEKAGNRGLIVTDGNQSESSLVTLNSIIRTGQTTPSRNWIKCRWQHLIGLEDQEVAKISTATITWGQRDDMNRRARSERGNKPLKRKCRNCGCQEVTRTSEANKSLFI